MWYGNVNVLTLCTLKKNKVHLCTNFNETVFFTCFVPIVTRDWYNVIVILLFDYLVSCLAFKQE